MTLTVGEREARRRPAILGCALVLAATACGRSAGAGATLLHEPSTPRSGGPAYTLVQMNLCLSGLAECFGKVAYPAAVQEATMLLHDLRPDAATVSEACRGDAALIARGAGYRMRFTRVIYGGQPLPCVDPAGRGLFGDAVLTRAAITGTHDGAFRAQAGIEQRRWLCVTTRAGVEACTAHLSTRSGVEAPANAAQCTELAAILARQATARPLVFGGDVNRGSPCTPAGFWSRTDASAGQDPGLQQIYGNGVLRAVSTRVLPFRHSDHDVLLVRAELDRG
jgi:hypothetical protein